MIKTNIKTVGKWSHFKIRTKQVQQRGNDAPGKFQSGRIYPKIKNFGRKKSEGKSERKRNGLIGKCGLKAISVQQSFIIPKEAMNLLDLSDTK